MWFVVIFVYVSVCVCGGGGGSIGGSLVYVFVGIGKFVVAVYASRCRLIARLINELCCW